MTKELVEEWDRITNPKPGKIRRWINKHRDTFELARAYLGIILLSLLFMWGMSNG